MTWGWVNYQQKFF